MKGLDTMGSTNTHLLWQKLSPSPCFHMPLPLTPVSYGADLLPWGSLIAIWVSRGQTITNFLYISLSLFLSLCLSLSLSHYAFNLIPREKNHLYAFWFISKYYKRTLTCFYLSCSVEADIIIYKILYWMWHRSTRPKIFPSPNLRQFIHDQLYCFFSTFWQKRKMAQS